MNQLGPFDPWGLFQRMTSDLQNWIKFGHLNQLLEQVNRQLTIEEFDDRYLITVSLDGIRHPNDLEAFYQNQILILRRTVELETKTEHSEHMVWQSYQEHFEKAIPLTRPVNWPKRIITAEPGLWQIELPKK
ncbi:Hsp20/alpha crystallin family protein [Effusibacillus dendaii]|uniref:SHSP domain-containing protein n=1 Tax=Effusibacillus dendaii TaxID=2743772 RepID=A0A7I8D5V9_9BACL|nr:Hsp20/alpha crystallin family protein [Effusibacillus dendaii]BCJ85475.1 hypothetical protein skT53_04600 [Effusibacillus dendaii]